MLTANSSVRSAPLGVFTAGAPSQRDEMHPDGGVPECKVSLARQRSSRCQLGDGSGVLEAKEQAFLRYPLRMAFDVALGVLRD